MTSNTRPPGRPRDAGIDEEIVRSLFDLVDQVGLSGATIEAIAERAGVSKATIYRRWSSKEELVVDAVAGLVGDVVTSEGEGIREILLHSIGRLKSYMSESTAGAILPWMIGEVALGSDIGRRYVDAVIKPGREALAGHMSQAVERGELRVDLDIEVAADMLLGPLIVTKLLGSYRPPREDWVEKFIDALLDGWRA